MALQGLLGNPNFDPTASISNATDRAAHLALLAADNLLEEFKEYPQGW